MGFGCRGGAECGLARCGQRERKIAAACWGALPFGRFQSGEAGVRLREDDSREIEIFELCADCFSFGEDRGARGETFSFDRSGGGGAEAAYCYAGAEPLVEGRCGFAARDYA